MKGNRVADKFAVDRNYLEAFAGFLFDETDDVSTGNIRLMRGYAKKNCYATGKYTGIMEFLKPPVDLYANALWDRLGVLMSVGFSTASEIRRAKILYGEHEKKKVKDYRKLEHYYHNADSTHYFRAEDPYDDDSVDLSVYGLKASSPDHLLPPTATIDFGALFDEFGADLKEIDQVLTTVLGWPVHRELVLKLTGDWSQLARAGEALKNIGNNATTVAGSIEGKLSTFDSAWNGAAAQGCVSHLKKFCKAVSEEGPINRTIGSLYAKLAEQVKNVAEQIVEALNKVVKKIKEMLPSDSGLDKLVDVLTYWDQPIVYSDKKCQEYRKVAEYIFMNRNLFNSAADQVKFIYNSISEAIIIIRLYADPINQVNEIKEVMANVSETKANASDLIDLADPSELVGTPHSGYTLPTNPWANEK